MRPSTLLLGCSLASTALALPTVPLSHADLVERDGPVFDGYIECSDKQTNVLNQAFDDAIRLVALPSQLSLNNPFTFFSNPCTGICSEGTLETRFWGKDIGTRPDEYSLIQSKFHTQICFLITYGQKFRAPIADAVVLFLRGLLQHCKSSQQKLQDPRLLRGSDKSTARDAELLRRDARTWCICVWNQQRVPRQHYRVLPRIFQPESSHTW